MRAVINISVGNTKSLVAEIDRLHRRNEESERRIESMRETHERSLDTNFERDQKRLKSAADEKRLDEGMASIRTLLPFMVNAMAKRQMVPTGDSSVIAEALRPTMESLTWIGFQKVLSATDFGLFFTNSLVVTLVSLVCIVLFGAMAAWALTEYRFPGNTLLGLFMALGIMIPIRLGTVAIVEPDTQWWRELSLGSPEAIIKMFVQQSGCFGLVNRGRSMASRNIERAMADSGELQSGSNLGKGQVNFGVDLGLPHTG